MPVGRRSQRQILKLFTVRNPAGLGLKSVMYLDPFLNFLVRGNLTRHRRPQFVTLRRSAQQLAFKGALGSVVYAKTDGKPRFNPSKEKDADGLWLWSPVENNSTGIPQETKRNQPLRKCCAREVLPSLFFLFPSVAALSGQHSCWHILIGYCSSPARRGRGNTFCRRACTSYASPQSVRTTRELVWVPRILSS